MRTRLAHSNINERAACPAPGFLPCMLRRHRRRSRTWLLQRGAAQGWLCSKAVDAPQLSSVSAGLGMTALHFTNGVLVTRF